MTESSLQIYYPYYPNKILSNGSNINPLEEFVYFAVSKYIEQFSDINMTLRDFAEASQDEQVALLRKYLIESKLLITTYGDDKRKIMIMKDNALIAYVEFSTFLFNIFGTTDTKYRMKLDCSGNDMFDFAIKEISEPIYFSFSELDDNTFQIRILLSMLIGFDNFGEFVKFRTLNTFRSNNIYPLLKKRLGIDDNSKEFLNIDYNVDNAVVVYSPTKVVDNFEDICAVKVNYATYATDINLFLNEINHDYKL